MSTNAKTVKVEVLLNSLAVPVSQIVLTHTVNELPQVSFNTQIDNRNGGSTEINIPTFMKFCANQQSYLVNRFHTFGANLDNASAIDAALKADLAIKVVDGDSNVLNFSGFLSQPSFSVMQGQLNMQFNGIHSMAMLQNLSLQLYPLIQLYAVKDLTLPTGTNESFNSIGTHVDAIISNIFDQFETALNPTFRNYTELQGTHAINRAVYNKFAKNFLEISKGRTLVPLIDESLPGQVKGSAQARVDCEIERLLLSSQNFFSAILEGLIPSFKFQMNADWNGKAWLEVIRMHEDPGARLIVAPLENVRFNVAASIEAPLSRVYVRAGRLDLYAYLDQTSNSSDLRQMVAYPPISQSELDGTAPELGPGVAYVVDAPEWLQDNSTAANTLSPTDDSDLTIDSMLAKFRTQESTFRAQLKARLNILQWLAEFTYKEHFLRYTTAYVSTPLNLLVEVGKTYQVKSTDGVLLFTGYLQSVSHTINLGQEGGEAVSALVFSHIKASGVTFNDLTFQQFVAQAPQIAGVDTFPATTSAQLLPDSQV